MLIAFASCKSERKTDVSMDTEPLLVETENKRYTISDFGKSTQFPKAELSNMRYNGGHFDFDVEGGDYQLGVQTPDAAKKMCANSAKGQHIHLIVDSNPYSAQYVASFDHEVGDGEHNILAFLSRSYHESIKTPSAHIAQRVKVEGGSIVEADDITDPMLFYSRPKGTYVGDDTKRIMLDFYPVNAEIGEDYNIKLQVNGEITVLKEWKPYFIENLPYGQSSVGIALVYPDGSPVPGKQTAILQTITLREDPLPEN